MHSLKMFLAGRQIFLWIGLLITTDNICFSQDAGTGDSLEYKSQLELFDDVIGIESGEIINGPKHTVALQLSGTHPFYNSSTGAIGSVTFGGQPYFNLTLLYDLYSDELVIQHLGTTGLYGLIVLDKAKVESFMIHGHTFRNYRSAGDQSKIVGGYYDVLYDGAGFTLLAKRNKDTKVEMGSLTYDPADQYFLIPQTGKAMAMRGMRTFYQVLDNKELDSELNSIVKKNNLKVNKSERDLIKVARYCDAILSKQK